VVERVGLPQIKIGLPEVPALVLKAKLAVLGFLQYLM
jgi:hypothetical protein